MRSLGMTLQSNGGSEDQWEDTKGSILRAFYSNLEEPFEGFTDGGARYAKARLRLFRNATQGIIGFMAPGTAYSEALQGKMNKLELDLTKRLCPYKKQEATPWPVWQRTLNAWAAVHSDPKRSWNSLVRKRQLSWYKHCQRHPEAWVSQLLKVDTPEALQRRRMDNYGTLAQWQRRSDSGRTTTRVTRERVVPRWSECFARCHPDSAAEIPLGKNDPRCDRANFNPLPADVTEQFLERIGFHSFRNAMEWTSDRAREWMNSM